MCNISRFFTIRILGHFIGGLLMVIMINGCNAAAQIPAMTPKAIFIIVDGIPADVLERIQRSDPRLRDSHRRRREQAEKPHYPAPRRGDLW